MTSYDIAALAGVSQATVSRVLNNNPRVNEEAKKRVLAALEEHSFVPNASAKTMRTARSDAIGIVTSEWLNPYVPELLDALTREARSRGLNVLLWNDSDADSPMAVAGASGGAVDGIIYTAAKQDMSGPMELDRRGFPVVLANRAGADTPLDQVTSDHEASGFTAADYLLEHDRTSIAAVFGPRDTFSSPARETGFRRRLEEESTHVPDELWFVGETTYEHGWECANRILERGTLPDAVYCSADIIAIGAISAFHAAGVRTPDDLWIMGNDGLPMSAWAPYRLTTQRQPIELIARMSLDRLVARMSGGDDGIYRQLLPTEFVVRESTANAPR